MNMYLPFKELTLPENAYDKQLHRDLMAKIDVLAENIPAYEVFAQNAAARIAEERYGYGGTTYMPYGWFHPSWVMSALLEKESRGRPVKKKNPLRALSYIYRYDSAGQVVAVELHQARSVLRPASKCVTFFVRDDELETMYTFSDFHEPADRMHLYSVAWVDHVLRRQHIINGTVKDGKFKCDFGITEICYTLAINGKSYCDRYEYSRVSDLQTVTTLDYEYLDLSKI